MIFQQLFSFCSMDFSCLFTERILVGVLGCHIVLGVYEWNDKRFEQSGFMSR